MSALQLDELRYGTRVGVVRQKGNEYSYCEMTYFGFAQGRHRFQAEPEAKILKLAAFEDGSLRDDTYTIVPLSMAAVIGGARSRGFDFHAMGLQRGAQATGKQYARTLPSPQTPDPVLGGGR